jgi:hypothetical protein
MHRLHTILWAVLALFSMTLSATNYRHLSELEFKAASDAMTKHGLELDDSPHGKRIDRIHVEVYDPFVLDDGIIRYLNYAHWTSREIAILENLVFKPGETYDPIAIRDSELQLTKPRFRSLVVILPVQRLGDAKEDTVDILVVTKDVFALRIETGDFSVTGAVLNQMTLSLAHNNFLGLNKILAARFNIDPFLWTVGANYIDTNIAGSFWTLDLSQSVVLDRQTSQYAGLVGSFSAALPLYRVTTPWAMSFDIAYEKIPVYYLQGSGVRQINISQTGESTDDKYHWLDVSTNAHFIRSYGTLKKHNIEFGYNLNIYEAKLFDDIELSDVGRSYMYDNILPVSERDSFINVGYNYYWNQYSNYYDYNTYALLERVRTGPQVHLTADFGSKPILASSRSFVRPSFSLGYTCEPYKSSLISFGLTGRTRIQPEVVDNYFAGDLTLLSPTFFSAGRFFAEAKLGMIWNDRNHTIFGLGGNNGLRGMPSNYFVGTNYYRTSIEFRSASYNVWILRLGGVVFYDVGAAFNNDNVAKPTQSVGAGLRVLIVPLNREVIRVDVGFPVSGPVTGFSNALVTFGFNQNSELG